MKFEQGQSLWRQNRRHLALMDLYRFRWRENGRATKLLDLGLSWIDRFTHGRIRGEHGAVTGIQTSYHGAMNARQTLQDDLKLFFPAHFLRQESVPYCDDDSAVAKLGRERGTRIRRDSLVPELVQ